MLEALSLALSLLLPDGVTEAAECLIDCLPPNVRFFIDCHILLLQLADRRVLAQGSFRIVRTSQQLRW